MTATIIIVSIAFYWLLLESNFLTIRLMIGDIPTVARVFERAECRKHGHYQRMGYIMPARTLKLYGTTANLYEGCNLCRAKLLKDVASAQKRKSTITPIGKKGGYGIEHGEIDIYVDGKHKANINSEYKRGMIKQAMRA